MNSTRQKLFLFLTFIGIFSTVILPMEVDSNPFEQCPDEIVFSIFSKCIHYDENCVNIPQTIQNVKDLPLVCKRFKKFFLNKVKARFPDFDQLSKDIKQIAFLSVLVFPDQSVNKDFGPILLWLILNYARSNNSSAPLRMNRITVSGICSYLLQNQPIKNNGRTYNTIKDKINNIRDLNGNTILHYLFYFGKDESSLVAYLWGNGIQICGPKRLYDEINDGNVEKVKELLSQDINPNGTINNADLTPLACYVERMAQRENRNVSVYVTENISDYFYNFLGTALHFAVKLENLEIVKLLCKAPGIKINVVDVFGKTPLEYARENKNQEIESVLLNKK